MGPALLELQGRVPPSCSRVGYIDGVVLLCSHKQWALQAPQALVRAEWGFDSAHVMKDRVVDHRRVAKGLFRSLERVAQTEDVDPEGSFP